MRFECVSIYPAFSREILVEWGLSRATERGDYLFHVERAGSPEGPFERLTSEFGPVVNKTFFVDRSAPLLSKENHWYYRIIGIAPSGKEYTSPAKDLYRNLERRSWLIAREITRKETLRFRKYVGVRAVVLKKKHFGELCTECVDPVGGDVTDSQCEACFGTRFLGGYYSGIEAWIETSPLPDQKGLGGQGWMTEDYTGQIRMISYPLVTREDLIVEVDSNRRLRVLQVDPIELRTVPLIQLVSVKMISRSDVEYRVPAYVEEEGSCPSPRDPGSALAPHGKAFSTVQPEDDC